MGLLVLKICDFFSINVIVHSNLLHNLRRFPLQGAEGAFYKNIAANK